MMGIITLASCNKDKDSGENFSKATPAEHKQALQKDASEVAGKLDQMKNLKAIIVMEEFMEKMDETGQPKYVIEPFLKSARALKGGAKAALAPAFENDLFPFSDWFSGHTGIYTYNETTYRWDRKSSTSELTYKFNSDAGEKVVITVSEFKTGSKDDLITSAKAVLIVDAKTLMTISFAAAYDKDGEPTLWEQIITMDQYIMRFKSTNEKSYMALDYSFTFSNENIFSAHFDSKGNFDLDELGDVFEPDMDPEDAILEQDMIESANIWIALGNLKFDGFANWKGLNEQLSNSENAQDQEGMMKAMANALENNVKIYIRYFDSNQIIAKSEFYAKETSEYGSAYWSFDMRMKFGDGSNVDETFLTEGIGGYLAALSGVFEDVQE